MRTSCDSGAAGSCVTDDEVPAADGRSPSPASGGLRELGLVAVLYLTYTGSRLLAARDRGPAVHRARLLQHLEVVAHLDLEHPFVAFLAAHHSLALLACYWYSAAHYVVTPAALLWLYRRGPDAYLPARRALLIATVVGLSAYLAFPTAPPRMIGGYADILARHASAGWWGADASAPRGLGGLTNELAAFPSLHAGWSLWVALVAHSRGRRRVTRLAGWAYAGGTAVVVVGTANHWTLDVVGGWLVVALGWVIATRGRGMVNQARPVRQEHSARSPTYGGESASAGRTSGNPAPAGSSVTGDLSGWGGRAMTWRHRPASVASGGEHSYGNPFSGDDTVTVTVTSGSGRFAGMTRPGTFHRRAAGALHADGSQADLAG